LCSRLTMYSTWEGPPLCLVLFYSMKEGAIEYLETRKGEQASIRDDIPSCDTADAITSRIYVLSKHLSFRNFRPRTLRGASKNDGITLNKTEQQSIRLAGLKIGIDARRTPLFSFLHGQEFRRMSKQRIHYRSESFRMSGMNIHVVSNSKGTP